MDTQGLSQSLAIQCCPQVLRTSADLGTHGEIFLGQQELSAVQYVHFFLKFHTVWCKSICLCFPEEGGMHRHMPEGIISFELSLLVRCMSINSNEGCLRVAEKN